MLPSLLDKAPRQGDNQRFTAVRRVALCVLHELRQFLQAGTAPHEHIILGIAKIMHETSKKILSEIFVCVVFAFLRFGAWEEIKYIGKRVCFPMYNNASPLFYPPLNTFSKRETKIIIFNCCFPLCVYAFYTRPGHGSPRHSTGTEEMTPREAGLHVFPRRVSCFPFYAFLALFYRNEIQEIIPIKHHPCCQLH